MKQKITLLIFLTIALKLTAQINEGGTPIGITNHLASQATYVNMPSFDLQQMQAEDAINDQQKGWWRFGFNHDVSLTQQNSGVNITLPGGRLWLLGIHSSGALSLNLAFKNFNIPAGAKMFVYSSDGAHVLGAFTSANNQENGEFATELVLGESSVIEYYEPQEVAGTGTFELFRVTHAYRGVADYISRNFGDAGSCQVNVVCPAGAPWANEIKSACLVVIGGNGFCSGSLINNVRQDGTPYILTANHCSVSGGFNTWLFRFNWQSPTCNNPASQPAFNSVNGCVEVASNAYSDFCLVRMNSTPPANYNVYYSGWSNVNTPVPSVVGIHHPNADIKKISFANNPTVSVMWNGADTWQVGPWTTGTTEPGSSGSPIYDPNHHIIGQLFGGLSACGLPPDSQIDNYGKFSTSWGNGSNPSTRLRDWLDPDNTCATVLDGYNPNIALPSLDAEILAIENPVCNSTACLSSITPSVKLRNRGTTTLTSVTINWKLDNNPPTTFSWTGSLAANATTSVSLPAINPPTGSRNYTVYTSSPNGSTDLNQSNDTLIVSFTIISPSTMNLPVAQSFQNSTFPPTNWTRSNPDGGLQWQRHATAGAYGGSPGCAYMNNFLYSSGSGESDFLVTPEMNFSSQASPLRIYFDVAYAQRTPLKNDSLIISYSADCGFSWTRLYSKGRAGLATNGGTMVTTSFLPTATQWRTDSVNIDALGGATKVLIRFENKSANGNNLYIDNINIMHGILDVGMDELTLQNSFVNIFPNPSDGNIQITFDDAINGTVALSLYNSYGQNVFSQVVDAGKEHTLNKNFSALAKGVYFLHFIQENKTAVRKIVLTD